MVNELSLEHVEQLTRSFASTRQLPEPAVGALLDTCRAVLRRERVLTGLLGELSGPFYEVRHILNELHNLTAVD